MVRQCRITCRWWPCRRLGQQLPYHISPRHQQHGAVQAVAKFQIGWDAEQKFVSTDFVAQARQALANIVALVAEAGGGPEHITRLTWFVIDKKDYLAHLRELGDAYRAVMGKHFPTMTLVQVVALVEDLAKVEIEATAVVPHR